MESKLQALKVERVTYSQKFCYFQGRSSTANIGHAEARVENTHFDKMVRSPLVCVIIKICKKHLVLKTNSIIDTYIEI